MGVELLNGVKQKYYSFNFPTPKITLQSLDVYYNLDNFNVPLSLSISDHPITRLPYNSQQQILPIIKIIFNQLNINLIKI